MTLLRKPFQPIRDNLRTYLALNAVMYGLFLFGFGLGLAFPGLSQARGTALEEDGTADLVRSLFDNPWLFALVILGVNTLKLSALTIVLPSLIVPFAGVAFFACWAVSTGVTLVPTSEVGWVALLPHSLTVVVEFQAYIILVLGVYLLGRNWLRPRSIAAENRRRGYLRGVQQLGWLSLAAFALLIIGAIYEAFSLRYFVGPLAQWLL